MKRVSPILALLIGLALFSGAVSYAAKADKQKTNLNTGMYSRAMSLLGIARSTAMAGITVNSTADTATSDGQCTLREAINNANIDSDTTSGDCAAGSGADVITITPTGTITLSSALPNLSTDITINGPGAALLSISGNNTNRVFFISIATVNLTDLTVTAGRTANGTNSVATGTAGQDAENGGGIYNDFGALTLTNCVVSGNVTGNGGTGGPSGSAGSGIPGGMGGKGGNGAGIYKNGGALILNNTTVSGNTAGNGGAGGGGAQNGGDGGKGGSGAGIYSFNGVLVLTDSAISGNNAGTGGPGSSATFNGGSGGAGGDGGGLYIDGNSAFLINTTLSNNRAGNGNIGAPGSIGNNGGLGGNGGSGGAIYNTGGILTLNDTTITGNFSGTGGNSGFGTNQSGAGGFGGNGAGVFNTNATLTITNGSVDTNQTGNGGSASGNSAVGSDGGGGGSGAGVYFDGGTATLTNLTLRNNATGSGGNASNGAFDGATGADGGSGAGLNVKSGTVTINGSAIFSNATGNGGVGTLGRGGGSGGNGAGVLNAGTLTIFNSTVSSNTGGNGNTGQTLQGPPSGGAGGSGAGIYNNGGTLKTINVTVAGNSGGVDASGGTTSSGGGIRNHLSGTAHLRNTIVSDNSAQTEPDVTGVFLSDGHNFVGKNGGSGFTNGVNGDQVGTVAVPKDPLLGPLQNNGGPTQTRNLPPNSQAVDAGDNCVLTVDGCGDNNPAILIDQRVLARPQGPTVDIGAVEAILQVPNAPDLLAISDSGTSDTDNTTNATNLQFQVDGAIPNGTVELLRNGAVVTTAIADGSGVALLAYNDNSTDGSYNFTAWNTISGAASVAGPPLAVTIDRPGPTVTINQAGGQADPTPVLPINFTVVFNQSVTGFTSSAISLTGSADVSAASINVTGSGTTYNVAVGNVLSNGTVQASVTANAVQDSAGNNSAASTSGDNTVVYDNAQPTVTIEQASAQSDPTSSLPITFTVVFSEPVTGFTNSDVSLSSSAANVSSASVNVTGSGANYTVTVDNVTGSGTVVASIPAGAAADGAGNLTTASTSVDNSVTFNLPLTVTINQAAGQFDPTNNQPINYTVIFSQSVSDFTGTDVSLSGSTANVSAASINVTGSGTTYNVAVSNITADGVVQASVPAGVATNFESTPNTASTSTDNMVTLDTTSPTVTINQASGQSDPTSALPINFDVIFDEPVTGFTSSDVLLSGSADLSLATITVTGSGATYTIAAGNVMGSGTVQVSIPANAAVDGAGNQSLASTSTDNVVSYTAPAATNLTVNLLGDAGDGVCDATCTLRDAITSAGNTAGTKNIGFNLPSCTTGSPCTIIVPSVLQPTNGPIIINGPGASVLSLSGNNASRVFLINDNVGLSLSGLTITNGRAPNGGNGNHGGDGGAILNQGTLLLSNSAIANSNAGNGITPPGLNTTGGNGGLGGGIANTGNLSLVRTTVSGNNSGLGGNGGNGPTGNSNFDFNGVGGVGGSGGHGGGISSTGQLTVIESTLSGNRAGAGGTGGASNVAGTGGRGGHGGNGGGIYNTGRLSLINATETNNNSGNGGTGGHGTGCGGCLPSVGNGGAGGNGGYGGGIFNTTGTSDLLNTTISGNNLGNPGIGGVGDRFGDLGPSGAPGIAGGVANSSGSVNPRNTIIAKNPNAGPDVQGVFTSSGNNLIGKTDGSSTGFTHGVNGDKVGTASAIDPLLGPLQNNGGATQTLAPLTGSPTINAGSNCVLTANGCADNNPALATDQRLVNRQLGSSVDIGSVEFIMAPATPDLLPGSDTYSSNSDNFTSATDLQFLISGTLQGATVELLRDGIVVASGMADGSGSITLGYIDNSVDGTYNFTSRHTSNGILSQQSSALPVTINRAGPPAVTINQASGQSDPANTQPVSFTVVFTQPVTGFSSSGVSLAGSSANVSAANIGVTGSGATYTVSVSNVLSTGTVQASILANSAMQEGLGNQASTSTDNTVTIIIPVNNLVVNLTGNSGDGVCDATCTLRDAITTANGSSQSEIITFNLPACTPGIPCTIRLTSGELAIANNGAVQIVGPGTDVLTISGNNQSRIFNVALNAPVSISKLRITSGFSGNGAFGGPSSNGTPGGSGGGIYNNGGSLTLSECVITGNRTGNGGAGGDAGFSTPLNAGNGGSGGHGGGIFNSLGTLTLTNCSIAGNTTGNGGAGGLSNGSPGISGAGGSGAGIYNSGGILLLMNVTVSSNPSGNGPDGNQKNSGRAGDAGHGGSGAGIFNSGTLTLINGTVSGNTGGSGGTGGFAVGGGAIAGNGGNGGNGGIHNTGTLLLVNSTITDNRSAQGGAGGGILFGATPGAPGAPGNGAGVLVAGGTARTRNTILAGNILNGGGVGPNGFGAFNSLGNNVIGDTAGTSGFGASGDQQNVNPLLGLLTNNGGPTLTHNIASNSPARDAGDNCVLNQSCATDNLSFNLSTDQRGGPRPEGATVDIGAVEFGAVIPPQTVYAGAAPGTCGGNTPCFNSLQGAIDAVAAGGTVYVLGGIFNESINLNKDATLNILGNTTINDFTISDGTVNGNNFTLTLVSGNWTNNGGTFNPGTGTVNFSGSGQSIGGSLITTFNKLTVGSGGTTLNSAQPENGSAATVVAPTVASVGAIIQGLLTLDGDLTVTSPAKLIMTPTATSAGSGDVIGSVVRAGITTGNAFAFGNLNNQIAFTGGTLPTDVTVNLVKTAPGGFPNAVQRTYTITQNNGSGFSATLRLRYLDGELGSNDENTMIFWRLRSDGIAWQQQGASSRDTTENWLQKTGVTQFSPWIMANVSPTAANGTVSGRVLDDNGAPVAGVVLHLTGTQNRKMITNAKGDYFFDGIETSGFYTVTASRANYNFNPFNRTFTQLGNHTDAGFNAAFMGDAANPLDTPEFFVRQQYVDILGREPDEGGFNYWSNEMLRCGSDTLCSDARRRDIAAAFFIEQEFQQSGSYIYNLYSGALGRKPRFTEYASDRRLVVGGAELETQKAAFTESFVQRPDFVQKYQANITADSFVDALLQTVQQSSGVDLGSARTSLLGAYNSGANMTQSRSLVLRSLADKADFKRAEYNAAFVLTEYFGYLRRDAEPEGFDFWLNVLNNREAGNFRGMVCSFITSTEYQKRFSNVVTHSNAECAN